MPKTLSDRQKIMLSGSFITDFHVNDLLTKSEFSFHRVFAIKALFFAVFVFSDVVTYKSCDLLITKRFFWHIFIELKKNL